jgi:Type IV secretion-system coupling protein DNA-binding domain
MHAHDTPQLRRTHAWAMAVPALLPLEALAQAAGSPFMTGATALQTNILAWLTPIAVILVIAQVSSTYGGGEAQTLVENCGNTLILRCSGSEHGGTSQFASRLIGEREVTRIATSRSRRATDLWPSVTRAEHCRTEAAVMGSQIEQLPDLSGYLKFASSPAWRRVRLQPSAQRAPENKEGGVNVVRFPRSHTAHADAQLSGAAGGHALEP